MVPPGVRDTQATPDSLIIGVDASGVYEAVLTRKREVLTR
jgi:hypothetical protein